MSLLSLATDDMIEIIHDSTEQWWEKRKLDIEWRLKYLHQLKEEEVKAKKMKR